MTKSGVNVIALPLHRITNLVYAHLLTNRDFKEREKFISDLELPLHDEEIDDGVWADGATAQSALAAMKALEQFE